jgi:DNA mismatch repair protein PMS2
VCTRTADDELGTLLAYDRSGALVSQAKKARPVGTTIVVEDLFKPLPVRLKDFHRNIKKHYTKLLKVLQAYAVSCVRVKISVSNATGKSASNRQVVLATQAHQSMGDNIASVFGTKFFRTLKSVDFDLNETWPQPQEKATTTTVAKGNHVFDRGGELSQGDTQEDEEETKDGDVDAEDDPTLSQHSAALARTVVGYVSKVGEGVGRSDNDRQFFFINNRPFDLPKLSKAVNDVWRQFEMKQKPACVLNFVLPSGEFDVNVTPDKRETLLKSVSGLIGAIKRVIVDY